MRPVAAVLLVAPVLLLPACTSDAADTPETIEPTSYVEPLPARTFAVTIKPGHCWIDPVRIDGQLWGVDRRDQFGWGGGTPKDWSERGVAQQQQRHLVFTAEEGATLRLWPSGHRFYSDPTGEGQGCD